MQPRHKVLPNPFDLLYGATAYYTGKGASKLSLCTVHAQLAPRSIAVTALSISNTISHQTLCNYMVHVWSRGLNVL